MGRVIARWLLGLGCLALLAACTASSPAESLRPAASIDPATAECPAADITTPSGFRVRLTGVWRSNDSGVYDINQVGTCVHWLGMSQDVGEGAGQNWTNVFSGTIRNDLTIVGRWADVPFNPALLRFNLGSGSMMLEIDFDETGGVERPMLRAMEASGDFGGSEWVLEESLSAPVDLEGAFGGIEEEGCLWVEADGQRLELVGSAEWTFRNPPLSIQDGSGHILARVGDPIRVRGRESAALGSGCADTAIVVEELDPTP
jgi:hypothetical protein